MTREQGTGNREQGTGNRFWATLLFVTCVGFFPLTYLKTLMIQSNITSLPLTSVFSVPLWLDLSVSYSTKPKYRKMAILNIKY
ncbi:hypothetical protein PN451_13010 [Dolichospermum planctonicum CS-1226]|uniref:Uncharacterized protein n=1 Tax=Dolichospermum planctonicum CS-1226 TaxID=3021751 RepID=A0ABT5AHG6_9CYAN|nr:hypothetical protein [Dolichospermum planctonicum CS-1226]